MAASDSGALPHDGDQFVQVGAEGDAVTGRGVSSGTAGTEQFVCDQGGQEAVGGAVAGRADPHDPPVVHGGAQVEVTDGLTEEGVVDGVCCKAGERVEDDAERVEGQGGEHRGPPAGRFLAEVAEHGAKSLGAEVVVGEQGPDVEHSGLGLRLPVAAGAAVEGGQDLDASGENGDAARGLGVVPAHACGQAVDDGGDDIVPGPGVTHVEQIPAAHKTRADARIEVDELDTVHDV